MKPIQLLLVGMAVFLLSCSDTEPEEEEIDKEISTIQITELTVSVKRFFEVTFSAIATYEDGSTGTITNDATWTSSNPEIATISGGTATGVWGLY